MDSTFDRWGEAVVYLGIVIGCTARRLRCRRLAGRRGDGLARSWSATPGPGRVAGLRARQGHGRRRASRRARCAWSILGLGLVGAASSAASAWHRTAPAAPSWHAAPWALIAVLATITTIQRILFVRQAIQAQEVDRTHHEQERQERAPRAPNGAAKPRHATARSASRSWASATAPAASSRAATTTRTPRPTTSSRA